MESFWGSVQLMVFIYALAAAISLVAAWVIRLIFASIRIQKSFADSRNGAAPDESSTPDPTAPEQKA